MEKITAIVLAAGRGTRMKSDLPKVLHDLRGMPMVYHCLKELISLKSQINQIVLVVGYQGKLIEDQVKKYFPQVQVVYQKKQLGTADAVRSAKHKIANPHILITCADVPLVTKDTLTSFISNYLDKNCQGAVITAKFNEENDLGRVIRDSSGNIKAIREKIEIADPVNHLEVNSGIYLFERNTLLNNLEKIKKNPKKGEYFFTDIIELIYNSEGKLLPYLLSDNKEILGINTQKDLWQAEKIMLSRAIDVLASQGVRVIDPSNVYIEEGVRVGKNTIIFPFTFIEKNVIIGKNCSLGPFIRLRKGSVVGDNTCLGNFIEINRSKLGNQVKMKHFGYLGDTEVKNCVNIGAGTVVANYDGKNKNKTLIEQGAFIGSDTILVAPVKIGKGAATGAGSVVTHDVKPNNVVIGIPAKFFKRKS